MSFIQREWLSASNQKSKALESDKRRKPVSPTIKNGTQPKAILPEGDEGEQLGLHQNDPLEEENAELRQQINELKALNKKLQTQLKENQEKSETLTEALNNSNIKTVKELRKYNTEKTKTLEALEDGNKKLTQEISELQTRSYENEQKIKKTKIENKELEQQRSKELAACDKSRDRLTDLREQVKILKSSYNKTVSDKKTIDNQVQKLNKEINTLEEKSTTSQTKLETLKEIKLSMERSTKEKKEQASRTEQVFEDILESIEESSLRDVTREAFSRKLNPALTERIGNIDKLQCERNQFRNQYRDLQKAYDNLKASVDGIKLENTISLQPQENMSSDLSLWQSICQALKLDETNESINTILKKILEKLEDNTLPNNPLGLCQTPFNQLDDFKVALPKNITKNPNQQYAQLIYTTGYIKSILQRKYLHFNKNESFLSHILSLVAVVFERPTLLVSLNRCSDDVELKLKILTFKTTGEEPNMIQTHELKDYFEQQEIEEVIKIGAFESPFSRMNCHYYNLHPTPELSARAR